MISFASYPGKTGARHEVFDRRTFVFTLVGRELGERVEANHAPDESGLENRQQLEPIKATRPLEHSASGHVAGDPTASFASS
jgi:hypothetical protein